MIEEVDDGGVLVVFGRAENALRFVEHEIEPLDGRLDRFLLELDAIKPRYFGGMFRLRDPVDSRSSRNNPGPCAPQAH